MDALIFILCVLLVCGCATREPCHAPLAGPPPATATVALAAGERINLTLTTERDVTHLSEDVDAQGNIIASLLVFHVAGLTPAEAAKQIEQELSFKSRQWGHSSVSVKVSR